MSLFCAHSWWFVWEQTSKLDVVFCHSLSLGRMGLKWTVRFLILCVKTQCVFVVVVVRFFFSSFFSFSCLEAYRVFSLCPLGNALKMGPVGSVHLSLWTGNSDPLGLGHVFESILYFLPFSSSLRWEWLLFGGSCQDWFSIFYLLFCVCRGVLGFEACQRDFLSFLVTFKFVFISNF